MGDYGGKGSTPGFDVKTTIDYFQMFNSSWPLLKIGLDGNGTSPITHNLGYPPFHFITTIDGRVDQNAGIVTDNFGVDSSVLARNFGSGSVKYFICRLDLTTNFDSPIVSGGVGVVDADRDYGFKVAKEGKSVDSTDMRDFALHSSTRSLMVQKVDNGLTTSTGGGLGYERTVAHGLSYTPEAFAFILPGTNTFGLSPTRYSLLGPATGAAGAYYSVTSTGVYVTADVTVFSSPPRIAVVVLKDPLAKTTVNVNYP